MKLVTALTSALVLGASVVSASPHRHRHSRKEKREADTQVVTVPAPPDIVYVFDGKLIGLIEVCEGMKNGTFAFADDYARKPDCSSVTGASTSSVAPSPSSSPASAPSAIAAANAPAAGNAQSSGGSGSTSVSAKAVSNGGNGSGSSDNSDTSTDASANVDQDFPDGQISCDTFPSAYGAVELPWVQLKGWAGIQQTTITNGLAGRIVTAVAGQGCTSGSYCSYACPPGYQKSQWPDQSASSTSIGGLLCGADGKLHLTNAGLSKKLCIPGTGKANVINKLGKNVAICRTDYPGTESETIPLNAQPGQSYPLTCPDSATYYKHQGAQTTAQYYINPAGVDVSKACTWGSDETASGNAYGNWAPVNMGAGTDVNGNTWISLLSTEQNYPKAIVPLGFDVELQGNFGGSKCMYVMQNGKGMFCSGGSLSNPQNCHAQGSFVAGQGAVPGCTVQLFSGNATYVFS